MAVVGVSVCVHEQDPSGELLQVVRPLYAEIYAEPPYLEGPDEVADFAAGWTGCCQQPGFRLVVADADGEPVGFSFGHRLGPETDWWDGLLDPVPAQVTQEWERRTFAVIELAVRARHRRRGIGRILHQALLAGRDEQRVTLLSRPEAAAAQAAYA